MNSAAKLRNRGIAIIGATALVATAFGPAAMAWHPVPDPAGDVQKAGVASVGLIDADRTQKDTQGAPSVSPGVNNQAIGDVRFVFPSNWQAGDTLTFTLGSGSADATWADTPTVNIDTKAYDTNTHIALTSPVTGAPAGSVEAGLEKDYTKTPGPTAPAFKAAVAGNVLTVTFTNNADANVVDAKYIGAINGGKVHVPAQADEDISITMAAEGQAGSDSSGWSDTGGSESYVEIPNDVAYVAALAGATLSVQNGAVVADGTPQFVGPFTVTGALATSKTIEIDISGGEFDTDVAPTVKAYDVNGKDVTAPSAGKPAKDKLTITNSANAASVVITGLAVKSTAREITYTLAAGADGTNLSGVTRSVTGYLGDTANNYSQTDVVAPKGASSVSVRTASALANRLGGTDRYETATRVAASSLATDPYNPQVPQGESDVVVIASGENYADALSSGYLTATQNATLILTQKGQLSWAAENFLRTYGAKKVFIVGGEAAVSKGVEDKLRSLLAHDVQVATDASSTTEQESYTQTLSNAKVSIDGGTATDAAITATSNAGLPQAGVAANGLEVSVARPASGGSFTLTQATLTGAAPAWTLTAYKKGTTTAPSAPADDVDLVMSVQGASFRVNVGAGTASTTDKVTLDAAYTKQVSKTPTTGAITDKTATEKDRKVVAMSSNLEVIRIAGENRFVTNRNVNEYALRNASTGIATTNPEFGQPAKRTAIVANGLTPWDALASGPLVGSMQVATNRPKPIILTMGDSLEGQAKGQLSSLSIQHTILVGGNAVLPEGLGKELADRGVSSSRLAGANRWETGKAVGDFLVKSRTGSSTNTNPGFGFAEHNPYLANGGVVDGIPNANKWADALAIGPVAAKASRVVALTDSAKLPEATEKFFTEKAAVLDTVIPVGGVDVVSNAVVEAANKLALAK